MPTPRGVAAARRSSDAHGLHIHKLADAPGAQLAAVAGALGSAERKARVGSRHPGRRFTVAPVRCIQVANVRRKACGLTAVAGSRIGVPFFRLLSGLPMMPAGGHDYGCALSLCHSTAGEQFAGSKGWAHTTTPPGKVAHCRPVRARGPFLAAVLNAVARARRRRPVQNRKHSGR
jgi:hypothetical protein